MLYISNVVGDGCYYDADNPKGSCYLFPYDTLRWDEAESDCEERRGGVLTAFDDVETLRIISEVLRVYNWCFTNGG